MSHADFVHLHVHSAYSLSEGAIKLKELVELCKREGMPAVAVTDSGNLFGALEFSLAASDAGVQPIVGCQMLVDPDTMERGADGAARVAIRKPGARVFDKIVLLAQNETGYLNLMKLTSSAFLETDPAETPHIGFSQLAAHADGLIALTGGPEGTVGRLLGSGQLQAARGALEHLRDLFPGRLYIELMRHGLEEEERIEGDLVDLAYEYEIPLVATNDCYFADAGMYEAHDALLCIAGGRHVDDRNRRRLTPEHRFRSAKEMRELFVDLPEAVDNTLVIAKRCAYMPGPRKPILPPYPHAENESEEESLRRQAAEGLETRLDTQVYGEGQSEPDREAAAAPYRERLAFELDVIVKMGFPGYFLIVAEFIQWAKAHDIPVGPGRGSGAGSVVAWALSITDLDPLRFGLLFERFLNPERVSMPDFDIDFCQDRRDEVIDHVLQLYGGEKVAQIITFGKLQARAALRDVGRVLGMPYGQVDKISKLVPFNPANPPTLAQALEMEPELKRLRKSDETVDRLITIAMKLEGLYRHASTHAAGVVIGDRALDELLPLYRDPRSAMAATQFSMKYTELAGLVKFDFLGLKTLTVLQRAVQLLENRDVPVDLLKIPLDDRKTYEMLGKGDSTGVFQLESSGMRDVLRQMRPDTFEDIIALVALYRPGPMDNIPRFIACKHGREEPDYLHPKLEGILKETYGVMVYQEQVMQIAQTLSGYSLGSADLLRRAMGKKIKEEMQAQRDAFVKGAVERGVDEANAARIFDQVDKFAGYGFNKSHAAAYALVAYQTAWLKANYSVEFFAASMTLDMGNTDKLNTFRQELDRLGVPLLPPDVNKSFSIFMPETVKNGTEKGAIRYALGAIKNVGAMAMERVQRERAEGGPFRDVFDFAKRVGASAANKRQLENLIRAGALDTLNRNRRQLYESVDLISRIASTADQERGSNQHSLFGDAGGESDSEAYSRTLPNVTDWPLMERLGYEFEAIGFYLSAHPLDSYGTSLERIGVKTYAEFVRSGKNFGKLAGVLVGKQERTSSKGNRFAFLQLSDATGAYEVVVFAELLGQTREVVESGEPLLLTVEGRPDGEGQRLSAQSIERVDPAVARGTKGLKVVMVGNEMALDHLKAAIAAAPQGKGTIQLILGLDLSQEVEISLPGRYAISGETRAAIDAIPGVVEVREI